jgi:hypothetical protein
MMLPNHSLEPTPVGAGHDHMLHLTLPFRLRGHDGVVHVDYGVNTDPRRWRNILPGDSTQPLNRDDIGRGFPVRVNTRD